MFCITAENTEKTSTTYKMHDTSISAVEPPHRGMVSETPYSSRSIPLYSASYQYTQKYEYINYFFPEIMCILIILLTTWNAVFRLGIYRYT